LQFKAILSQSLNYPIYEWGSDCCLMPNKQFLEHLWILFY
jgi:hypothetical protein